MSWTCNNCGTYNNQGEVCSNCDTVKTELQTIKTFKNIWIDVYYNKENKTYHIIDHNSPIIQPICSNWIFIQSIERNIEIC